MKKTLVAIAALAATGAFAQSSVTLYGAVDASFDYAKSGSVKVKSMQNSQLGSSKLGFKGTEDLGGGLTAVFKLEGGLANDSGNGKASNTNNQSTGAIPVSAAGGQGLDFQRYSYVGLAGGFGELHLGREYIYSFWWAEGAVDPFSTNGPAQNTNMFYKLPAAYTATNASNMISYTSPEVSGVQGGAQYLFGENKSTAANGSDGNGYSAFVKYAQGPVFVSGAISKVQYYNEGDYSVRGLAASYDLGAAKLTYTYAKEKELVGRTNAKEQANAMNSLGVIVPMGAANFKATYTASKRTGALAELKGKQFGLGVDYALSKRTKLYTTLARVTNSGGNGTTNFSTGTDNGLQGSSSSHVAVGAYHSF